MGFFSKNKKENNGFIINTDDESIKVSGDKNLAPHAMTANEISELWAKDASTESNLQNNHALDSLKKRMIVSGEKSNSSVNINDTKLNAEVKPKSVANGINDKKTLVSKVKRYTIDEQGHNVAENTEPLYQLETVAEILKSDSEITLKRLSKKYNLNFDTSKKEEPKPSVEDDAAKPIDEAVPTPAFEKMVNDAAERETQELYENLFPSEKSEELPNISVPDISDIDTHELGISTQSPSNTATIRFTPISDNKGNTDHITVSSFTKHIDLDYNSVEDISSHSITQLEQSEFEDFSPKSEYTDINSGKKLIRTVAQRKRTYFLGASISALMLIALSVFLMPFVYDHIISNPKVTMFICSAFLSVSIIANADMFGNFKNLLKKRCDFDIMASICSVLTLSLGITAALTQSNAYYIILLCSITLFTRAVCKFKYASAQLMSLRQITNDRQKNAVTLINDPATTFAMVKNSIDGDILVAAHKKSFFIEDFMKHFEFHKTLFGKVSIVFAISLICSIVSGIIAYFYYDDVFHSLYAAACISCIAALPSIFFIDYVPFSSAAKKLKIRGSMISGLYGAQKIENANAAVIKTCDIFPDGTVTMHNMKVLSNNNIDQTLLRAASLTAAVGSPLESIFKKIAGSTDAYSVPDSDTIKYEKNLGISGWVDNEPLFIGNRSLMKAHGIEIPSLEIDKKILRKGYFPVYVATSTTACALIVIQYNVDPAIVKELHKITNLGVMLLVENCDPNVTEEMICDYFDLYDGSVKIMSNAGVHMLSNAIPDVMSCSSPAVYRGSGLNFIRLINSASSIKASNKILTFMYTMFAVFGILYFVYASFSGLTTMPEQTTVLVYTISTLILSIIGFLIRKP